MPYRKSYNSRPRRRKRYQTAGSMRRPTKQSGPINNNDIGMINNPGGISAGPAGQTCPPMGGGRDPEPPPEHGQECTNHTDCFWGGCECRAGCCWCPSGRMRPKVWGYNVDDEYEMYI